jgi:hypothetical protein
VQPVHFHVARDHLVLTDIRQLHLPDDESRALFKAAQALFEEASKTLVFGDAHTWFMCAGDWEGLRTASPDAASGHNIDIWLPQGNAERAWRKLQNEVQMQWHANASSQTHNNPMPANALWLWGGGKAQSKQPEKIYTDIFNLSGWMRAFTAQSNKQHQNRTSAEMISARPEKGLLVLDNLMSSALASDWGSWLQEMQRLEAEWFAPLLAALKSKSIDQITLIFSHNSKLVESHITRTSLLKFWAKPSLKQLLP